MTSITCGNCKRTHGSVADVKACYAGGKQAPLPTPWATMPKAEYDALQAQAERASEYERPTRPQRTTFGKRWTIEDSGIYVGDNTGDIYKVYKAMDHDTMLAKRLHILHAGTPSWKYEGSAHKVLGNLDNHHRITEAEAKQYGAIYGVCAICGRTLTDEKSIAQGIGPICIKSQGWAA